MVSLCNFIFHVIEQLLLAVVLGEGESEMLHPRVKITEVGQAVCTFRYSFIKKMYYLYFLC